MGILDDVVINAKSAAEAVGKKAGQIVDSSKLHLNSLELNADVNKRYEALGAYVYASCREALADNAEVMGQFAELDELMAQREAIEKELGEKSNKVVCPGCGRKCDNTESFCGTCGTKLGE